jgi:hypothetical protein
VDGEFRDSYFRRASKKVLANLVTLCQGQSPVDISEVKIGRCKGPKVVGT